MAKTIIALMYDFDKTLCEKDMQEYGFIPSIGMEAEEFWAKPIRLLINTIWIKSWLICF